MRMDEQHARRRTEQEAMDEDLAEVLMTISAVSRRLAGKLMAPMADERMNKREGGSHGRQGRDAGLHRRGNDHPEYRF
jgi:hypothetical protein